MKASEITAMTDDGILHSIQEARRELFSLRFQKATGQLKDTSRIGSVKRDIARLNTVLHERRLAAWDAQRREGE